MPLTKVLHLKSAVTAADAPRSALLCRDLGYEPIEVDISEFIKLEGCVTGLSVRIRDVA